MSLFPEIASPAWSGLLAEASLIDWIIGNIGIILGGVIVLAGIVVGWSDLIRLSATRIWALSSVSYRESVRRRVLWITPLAMLGVIAVTQLSHPLDKQDAVRQATKYCLFASGMVVVIATLILACTSLPKEIDNRVIYTIVTKPTTRLEIILGKTLGFARTSALILLIMGLFSYIYLQVNAAQYRSEIDAELKLSNVSDIGRETLQHYHDHGLLQAKSFSMPVDLQVYAKVPGDKDPYRWMFGNAEQNVLFPFELPDRIFEQREDLNTQLVFAIKVAVDQRELGTRESDEIEAATKGTTRPAKKMPNWPTIEVSILNEGRQPQVGGRDILDARHQMDLKPGDPPRNAAVIALEPSLGQPRPKIVSGAPVQLEAMVVIPQKVITEALAAIPSQDGNRRIFLAIVGQTSATRYGFGPGAVLAAAQQQVLRPSSNPNEPPKWVAVPPIELGRRDSSGKVVPPAGVFRARISTTGGQQLRGDTDKNEAPVGIYRFRNADLSAAGDSVPFEFRSKIERSGVEVTEAENATRVEFIFHNLKDDRDSESFRVFPESDRPAFFSVPRSAIEGGNFDVLVRSRTDGHYVGLRQISLQAVSQVNSFAYNLGKSLIVLWMLSVLVAAISIFCSTLVSWPIAVVLTLVFLLGRWCVNQVGTPATPQQIQQDLMGAKANEVGAEIFTGTVKGLNWLLQTVSRVLPDTEQFKATEDIERGVNIPHHTLLLALQVLAGYGAPVLILGYLRLRHKEVAP